MPVSDALSAAGFTAVPDIPDDLEQPSPPGGLRAHLLPIVIVVLASVLLTWPLVLNLNDTLLSWGDPVFQSWTIAWDWHALSTDPRHIFDANVFYPWRNTLAWSDHLFGQTLTVLPVIAFTENGILANNVAVLLAFIMSGLAMYLLVYDMTRNRVAALVAGLAYAFAPSRMAHLEHLHLLSAQFPPLLILCLRRVIAPPVPRVVPPVMPVAMAGGPQPVRLQSAYLLERAQPPSDADAGNGPSLQSDRGTWLLLLGLCFFLQGLFGIYFLYFSIILLLLCGGVWAVMALVRGDWRVLGSLGLAALACAIAGAVLLPTLWPYLQVNNDLHVERTAAEVDFWSATPKDYLAVAESNRLWNSMLGRFERDIEQALFPGFLLLVLAVVGLTHTVVGRVRWVLLALVLGSVVLSLGLSVSIFGADVPLPYRAFFDYVPGFRAIRVPARLGLLALVGVAALAGLGVDRVWRGLRTELPYLSWVPNRLARSPRLAAGLFSIVLLLVLSSEMVTRIDLPEPLPAPPTDSRADYVWLREHPAPTLELPMGEGPLASAWPNFWSMSHWNELVNGYSGIAPPTYYPFRERMQEFPNVDTLWLLQGMGVENIVVHGDIGGDRAALEAAIARQPGLTLALAGDDAVYTLAADPWMWAFADLLPSGSEVDLPDAGRDPVLFGMFLAILQREGHTVTGTGSVDTYTFEQPSGDACYVALLNNTDPARSGYGVLTPVAVTTPPVGAIGMTLFHVGGCDQPAP